MFGNFNPPQEAVDAIVEVVQRGNSNGYAASFGIKEAREAVAHFISKPEAQLTADVCCSLFNLLFLCIRFRVKLKR